MMITTEELRKLADHANERLLRVMPIDADMIASIAAELITARAKLKAAAKLAGAAGFYAEHYAQDEASDPELCVPGQHGAAISLFNALAEWKAAQ